MLFLVLVLAFTLVLVLVFVWMRRFTRERFAFVVVGTSASAFSLAVTTVAGGGPLVDVLIELINELFGLHLSTTGGSPTTSAAVVSLYALLVLPLYLIYRSWGGPQSVDAQAADQRAAPSFGLMVREAVSEIRYLSPRASREIVEAEPPTRSLELRPTMLPHRTWAEQVATLLPLVSPSYHLDEWHDLDDVWCGRVHGREKQLYVLCTTKQPDEPRLARFIDYARTHAQRSGLALAECELGVAFKSTRVGPSHHDVASVRVWHKSEAELLDELVDFEPYIAAIRKRVCQDRLEGTDSTLAEIFVEPKVENGERLFERVDAWLRSTNDRQLVLLGDYGQGKTSAAYMLCHNMLREARPIRVPILIELRGRSPRTLATGELLALWCNRYSINPQALVELHRAGRLMLIFEGFDEVDLVGDREIRRANMKALWSYDYRGVNTKLLFTGRPNFAFGNLETLEDVGVGDYCDAIRLDQFTLDDINEALRNSPHRGSIVDTARNNPLFLAMISRPSMLNVVTAIWDQFEADAKINAAAAMQVFVKRAYRREAERDSRVDCESQDDVFRLSTGERDYFMRGIAAYMATRGLPNQLSRRDFEAVVKQLAEAMPPKLPHSPEEISRGEPDVPLMQRLPKGDTGWRTLLGLLHTRGLLVNDEAHGDKIKFSHKSYMEYLSAVAHANFVAVPRKEARRRSFEAPFISENNIIELRERPTELGFFAEILCNTQEPGDDVAKCRGMFIDLVFRERRYRWPLRHAIKLALVPSLTTTWHKRVWVIGLFALLIGTIVDVTSGANSLYLTVATINLTTAAVLPIIMLAGFQLDLRVLSLARKFSLRTLLVAEAFVLCCIWAFTSLLVLILALSEEGHPFLVGIIVVSLAVIIGGRAMYLTLTSLVPRTRLWSDCCQIVGYDRATRQKALGLSPSDRVAWESEEGLAVEA